MRKRLLRIGLSSQSDHFAENRVQIPAMDVLHRVIVNIVILAHREDRNNVGMVQ